MKMTVDSGGEEKRVAHYRSNRKKKAGRVHLVEKPGQNKTVCFKPRRKKSAGVIAKVRSQENATRRGDSS